MYPDKAKTDGMIFVNSADAFNMLVAKTSAIIAMNKDKYAINVTFV